MKSKKFIMGLIILIFIITSPLMVKGVNEGRASVNLKLSSGEIKAGETFSVILNVKCEEGINGVMGGVSYDETALEYKSLDIGTKWSNLNAGNNSEIAVIYNASGEETDADIVTLTFKVKETTSVGTRANISINNLKIDSFARENSTINIGNKSVGITVVSGTSSLTGVSIVKPPNKTKYIAGENFDKTGMEVFAQYSDNSKKEIKNYKIENGAKLKKGQTKVMISYTEGNTTKSVEQKINVSGGTLTSGEKKGKIPNAGERIYLGMGMLSILLMIVAIGSYIRYRKYNSK